MTVTSTGAFLSALAANRPPNPDPTMTTRGRPVAEVPAAVGAGDVVMTTDPSLSRTPASGGWPVEGVIPLTTACRAPVPGLVAASTADRYNVAGARCHPPARARTRPRARRAVVGATAPAGARRRRPPTRDGA